MRACATSFVKSPTLVHVRTAPPAVELAELRVGVGPEPISASSTAPRAPDTIQWAHGYPGCMGVSMNGVQPGSRSVARLPSRSPPTGIRAGRSEEHTSELQSPVH